MNWWSVFTLGLLCGGIIAFLTARLLQEEEHDEAVEEISRRNGDSVMARAVRHRLTQGPAIVVIGGGTGLSTLLSGLKSYTRNLSAVVTVTDEGGSSGRLRNEWGVLPPGDIRNCMVALAENDSSLNRLLNFRFDRGDLAGHSLGNLMLLAATELTGDFRLAVEELNNLLAIRGRVLPVTTEAVTIKGRTLDGRDVSGELAITENGGRLESIWIDPEDAEPVGEVLSAIESADLLVLGPGSLFTSILPNVLLRRVAVAVTQANAPIVYIANLMTQPGETDGMTISDHVHWIRSALGVYPDYILANNGSIPEHVTDLYAESGAHPLFFTSEEKQALSARNAELIERDFVSVTEPGTVRHDNRKLAETLVRIAREEIESGSWKN